MAKLKDLIKPKGIVNIDKIFVNKNTGQMSVVLPKKIIKSIPKRVKITYW
jgi:hypothetical protein